MTTTMTHHDDATTTQLDLGYDGPTTGPETDGPRGRPLVATAVTAPRRGPARLCIVCGRVPAHVTLQMAERPRGLRAARLCLRCHHAVRQQRRMVRAQLDAASPRVLRAATVGLIVPRSSPLEGDLKYRQLIRSRRHAQKMARRVLETQPA